MATMELEPRTDGELLPVRGSGAELDEGGAFPYELLDPESQEIVPRMADQVRQNNMGMAERFIDNGKILLAARERIPRGLWQRWLQAEFGWSIGTAQKMMRVAEHFSQLQLATSQVSTGALTLLAQYDIPETIRQEAVQLIEAGDLSTVPEVITLIRQHDPGLAERVASSSANVTNKHNRQVVRDLAFQVGALSSAVRNMQQAITKSLGIPMPEHVADALERLQNISDVLLELVPSEPTAQRSTQQGIKRRGTVSKYVGVTWDKQQQQWRAQGRLKGKHMPLGYFDTEEDAARAYDAWARELYGPGARLNFPDDGGS